MSEQSTMKRDPDAIDEVHDLADHRDVYPCVVTPVAQFHPATADEVVAAIAGVVQRAHRTPAHTAPDIRGVRRAQTFEEGEVFMLTPPGDGFPPDRYLMDFYDVEQRDICSRMHIHTGMRYVRMMTGQATAIRVSSLSAFILELGACPDWPVDVFVDAMPDDPATKRHNFVVPPCSWVDMQVPIGTSHQFNASGPNAVIDSVHIEEETERRREGMETLNMMAQTIFLADERPRSDTCLLDDGRVSGTMRLDGESGVARPAERLGPDGVD